MKWKVSYRYCCPGPGGPFRGRDVFERKDRPKRGETVRAMFGLAYVTSSSKVTTDSQSLGSGGCDNAYGVQWEG